MTRLSAMLRKELLDLRLNPWAMLPALIGGLVGLLLPLIITVIVPRVSGESLTESGEFQMAIDILRDEIGTTLDPETAIQGFVFQQFLMLLILIPVLSATAIAAHSVVGEKQARTLEPLLATPITTFELLAAKTIAALLPALALTFVYFAIDLLLVALFARPGVLDMLLVPKSFVLILVLGPMATLASLQVAIAVSSRVEDERTAQAMGSFVAMPIVLVFVAPFVGLHSIAQPLMIGLVVALAIVNVILMRVSISMFDRESILTRWK